MLRITFEILSGMFFALLLIWSSFFNEKRNPKKTGVKIMLNIKASIIRIEFSNNDETNVPKAMSDDVSNGIIAQRTGIDIPKPIKSCKMFLALPPFADSFILLKGRRKLSKTEAKVFFIELRI